MQTCASMFDTLFLIRRQIETKCRRPNAFRLDINVHRCFCAAPLFSRKGSQVEAPVNNAAAMTSKQQWESQQALPEGKPSPTAAEVTARHAVDDPGRSVMSPGHLERQGCKTVITRERWDSLKTWYCRELAAARSTLRSVMRDSSPLPMLPARAS